MAMNGSYTGLRHAGGTHLCNRCGSEVIPPQDPDDLPDHIDPDNDRWPTTDEYDPDTAELVCTSCDRTWPLDCAHTDIVFTTAGGRRIEDGKTTVNGRCRDCDSIVRVALETTDITVRNNDVD